MGSQYHCLLYTLDRHHVDRARDPRGVVERLCFHAAALQRFRGDTSTQTIRLKHFQLSLLGQYRDLAIFNIRGNMYRLIVKMVFRKKRIYVKEFLTHAEYDKGAWKKWLP